MRLSKVPIAMALGGVVLSMTLAACGSDTAAKASNDDTKVTGSGTADPGSRKIGVLAATFQSELLQETSDHVTDTAKKLGWSTDPIDGGSTPEGFKAGMQKLLGEKVDAIFTISVEADPITKELEQAKAAGIPVYAITVNVCEQSAPQYTAVLADDGVEFGKKAADFIADKFPGQQVFQDNVSAVCSAQQFYDASKSEFGAKDVTVAGQFDADLADLQNSYIKGSQGLAQSNPKVKLVLTTADFAPPLYAAAFQQINRPDITVVSRYAVKSTLGIIESGANNIALAPNANDHVFEAFDRLLKHWVGKEDLDTTSDIHLSDLTVVDKGHPYTDPWSGDLKAQLTTWAADYKLP